jgi:hypothetical protein
MGSEFNAKKFMVLWWWKPTRKWIMLKCNINHHTETLLVQNSMLKSSWSSDDENQPGNESCLNAISINILKHYTSICQLISSRIFRLRSWLWHCMVLKIIPTICRNVLHLQGQREWTRILSDYIGMMHGRWSLRSMVGAVKIWHRNSEQNWEQELSWMRTHLLWPWMKAACSNTGNHLQDHIHNIHHNENQNIFILYCSILLHITC